MALQMPGIAMGFTFLEKCSALAASCLVGLYLLKSITQLLAWSITMDHSIAYVVRERELAGVGDSVNLLL